MIFGKNDIPNRVSWSREVLAQKNIRMALEISEKLPRIDRTKDKAVLETLKERAPDDNVGSRSMSARNLTKHGSYPMGPSPPSIEFLHPFVPRMQRHSRSSMSHDGNDAPIKEPFVDLCS